MEDLKNKVAVITGAASGIGRGIARACAAKGCHVVAADVDVAGAEQLASELAARGVRSVAVHCDVTDPAAIEALAERAVGHFGAVDVLCNNAGVGGLGLASEVSPSDVEWIFSVNVFGVLNGVRAFVPRFKAAGRPAHILNTGSEHSLGVPFPGMGHLHGEQARRARSQRRAPPRARRLRHRRQRPLPGGRPHRDLERGRTRGARFGGPVESPEQFREFMAAGMDPDEVGRIAVAGIERNDFVILTHPEVRQIAEERSHAVLGAFDAYFPR